MIARGTQLSIYICEGGLNISHRGSDMGRGIHFAKQGH